jgi:hypothetical protein
VTTKTIIFNASTLAVGQLAGAGPFPPPRLATHLLIAITSYVTAKPGFKENNTDAYEEL